MKRVSGVDHLFIKRLPDSKMGLIVANVVDDFLMPGTDSQMQVFLDSVNSMFTLGATCR